MLAIIALFAFAVSTAMMVGALEVKAKGWWVWAVLAIANFVLFVLQIQS